MFGKTRKLEKEVKELLEIAKEQNKLIDNQQKVLNQLCYNIRLLNQITNISSYRST